MKIRYTAFMSLLLTFMLAGCSKDEESVVPLDQMYEPAFSGSIEGFDNKWQGADDASPDLLRIYAVRDENVIVSNQFFYPRNSSELTPFVAKEEQSIAVDNEKKYQFYSYRCNAVPSSLTSADALTVWIETMQKQLRGGDMSHIRMYDFIYAKSEANEKEIEFRFKRATALLEFVLPAGVKSITLKADDPSENYAGQHLFSIKTEQWSPSLHKEADVNLMLGEPTQSSGEKAWMTIFPGRQAKTVDLIVQMADYTIYRIRQTTPAEGYRAGEKYTLTVDLQEASEVLEPPTQSAGKWLLGNSKDLKWFRDNVNCGSTGIDATLQSDIDLQGDEQNQWWPIGIVGSYTGHFDGNGYHVSGLYMSRGVNRVGLFGQIDSPACIEKLEVSGEIIAEQCLSIGGIVDIAYGGVISECCSRINFDTKNANNIGGIAGEMHKAATMRNCFYEGNIQVRGFDSASGGIVSTNSGTVENCYATGTFVFSSVQCGGICTGNSGLIRGCATLFTTFQPLNGDMSNLKNRINGYNSGESYDNIAYDKIDLGDSFLDDVTLQGISKSWEECLSPTTYEEELGWSTQIWELTGSDLPRLKVMKSNTSE